MRKKHQMEGYQYCKQKSWLLFRYSTEDQLSTLKIWQQRMSAFNQGALAVVAVIHLLPHLIWANTAFIEGELNHQVLWNRNRSIDRATKRNSIVAWITVLCVKEIIRIVAGQI